MLMALVLIHVITAVDCLWAVMTTTEGTEAGTVMQTDVTETSGTSDRPTSSSKIIIDSMDDIRPIHTEDSVRSSVIFFSASLSIFTAMGIVLFFRKCVTCPTRHQSRRRHFMPIAPPDIPGGSGGVVDVVDVEPMPKIVTSNSFNSMEEVCLEGDTPI